MDSSAFRAALEAEDPSAEAVVEGALHLAAAGPKSFRALSDAVQDTLRDSRRDAARIIALGDCLLQVRASVPRRGVRCRPHTHLRSPHALCRW